MRLLLLCSLGWSCAAELLLQFGMVCEVHEHVWKQGQKEQHLTRVKCLGVMANGWKIFRHSCFHWSTKNGAASSKLKAQQPLCISRIIVQKCKFWGTKIMRILFPLLFPAAIEKPTPKGQNYRNGVSTLFFSSQSSNAGSPGPEIETPYKKHDCKEESDFENERIKSRNPESPAAFMHLHSWMGWFTAH